LFALALQTEPKNKGEIENFLENYNYGGKDFAISLEDDVVVLVKYVDAVTKEYCSTSEYAEMLCLSVYEETGIRIKIGVGGKVSGITAVGQSFSQAISAVKMMGKINAPGSVHSYREFALEKALEELPENRRMEYVKILAEDGTKEFFKDKEMVRTAQAFLDNNLNASETSRALYIHRNTLNYRLDKIQNLTGFNLRKFADAVTFKMITVLYELLG
jgi:carbohydrate diacid regulator